MGFLVAEVNGMPGCTENTAGNNGLSEKGVAPGCQDKEVFMHRPIPPNSKDCPSSKVEPQHKPSMTAPGTESEDIVSELFRCTAPGVAIKFAI